MRGETADAEACAAARAACRHSFGALFLCYNLPRYKPAVPWGPEAASRLLEATVAAVRRNTPVFPALRACRYAAYS